jgi:serine kinase of HPr protein (carbohydrate metabolism regulator)
MGKAPADSAWITVMQNANVAAVALLADVSCVILSENVKPDSALSARAQEKGLTVFSADKDAFTLACAIQNLLSKP